MPAWWSEPELGLRGASVFWLLAARWLPLAVVTPWLAFPRSPIWLRVAIALSLALVFQPLAMRFAPSLPSPGLALMLAWLTELGVGALFAAATAVPLLALQWGGWLSDAWRSGMLADSARSEPLGLAALYPMAALALLWKVGAPLLILAQMASGLERLPVGAAIALGDFGTVAHWMSLVLLQAVAIAAVIAAPVAMAVLVLEVALGYLGRLAPPAAGAVLALPWRAVAGLLLAWGGLAFLMTRLDADFPAVLRTVQAVWQGLAP